MARPTKKSDERVEAILFALRLGAPRRLAANIAGISETTLYVWLNTYPELKEALARAEAECVLECLTKLRSMMNKNWRVCAWLLERLAPNEFGKRSTLRISQDISKADLDVAIFNLIEHLKMETKKRTNK